MSTTQRYCLRWNNHQSNLLTVFDQLLHEESFVDVTLAVEGQLLRAHKMVLSACSPYFQTLFINHPDKHPIVILKDVPYCDMRCLLDFMYRGEVSVDQDRLTAFLRIAETLRIKGLTEVNENETLYQQQQQQQPPSNSSPPNLHRMNQYNNQNNKILNSQKGDQSQQLSNSHHNNYLNASSLHQRRKRGRPRKLSGGSGDGTPAQSACSPVDDFENRLSGDQDESIDYDGSMMKSEVNNSQMAMDEGDNENDEEVMQHIKQEPVAGTSKDAETSFGSANDTISHTQFTSTNNNNNNNQSDFQLGDLSKFTKKVEMFEYFSNLSENNNNNSTNNNNEIKKGIPNITSTTKLSKDLKHYLPSTGKQATAAAVRRQVRRRTNPNGSPDTAEHLTEMSVRGLNLFRYASLNEGLYHCIECAKVDLHKTFKNKYSFQRHAFLYHEGQQRKVFPCPVCSKEFSRPDKMKNHMKTVHDCFMPRDCFMPMGYATPGQQRQQQQQLQKIQQQQQQKQQQKSQLQQHLQQQLQQQQLQQVYQKQVSQQATVAAQGQQKLQQILLKYEKQPPSVDEQQDLQKPPSEVSKPPEDSEMQKLVDDDQQLVMEVEPDHQYQDSELEQDQEQARQEQEQEQNQEQEDDREQEPEPEPEQESEPAMPGVHHHSQFLLPLLENKTNDLPAPLPANFEGAL